MTAPLRILHIEDSEADSRLIERQLRRDGLAFACRRVDGPAPLAEALAEGPWDLVLSDFSVPQLAFDPTLARIQAQLPDVPVIVLSGTITVDRAVSLLKQGVSDFVLKDSLLRLAPAIDRALKEAGERRARRAAESRLRLLSTALESVSQAVVITDVGGTILWANPAFTTLSGYTFHESVGRRPGMLLKSGVHDRAFYESFWRTLLDGLVWRGVMTNRRKNGDLYPEDQTVSPVRDDAGTITHFVGLKRDLTEERRLQAQLLQAQKMESVGLLAGGIAHDFNNLITAINGTAELAALDLEESSPVRLDLDRIRETGDRAAALTRQLLAFSRNQVLEPVVIDANTAVAGMADMLGRLLGEDVTLRVVPMGQPGWVLVDRSQLEQVILNLAVNARDAMPDGGVLEIAVAPVGLDEAAAAAATPPVSAGPYIRLSVRDTGTGMDEATRLRIFEPFFTTKAVGKGTGLGLATVYGIVAQSGGAIGVRSVVGAGTTFTVDLPRAEPARPEAKAAPAPERRGGETILLVEDEEFLRDLARRMLELKGYRVIPAADGAEALAAMARSGVSVDLLLTDVVMPGMSGRDLAERILETHPDLKVIYSSGYTEDVIVRKGLGDQRAHFLRKPFTIDDLAGKVREVLDS